MKKYPVSIGPWAYTRGKSDSNLEKGRGENKRNVERAKEEWELVDLADRLPSIGLIF
jgi:hypothetical protein